MIPKLVKDATVELFDLVEDRTFQNLQVGSKTDGVLTKQTIVNLERDVFERRVIGTAYFRSRFDFCFQINLDFQNNMEIEITRSTGNEKEELEYVYGELVRLKNEAIKRNLPQESGPKVKYLSLNSGVIKTAQAKMRYVQAYKEGNYPRHHMEIYKARNFKFVGPKDAVLKNWKKEAELLGIEF